MTKREKPKKKTAQQGGRGVTPRQTPKMKVSESGESEQGAPLELAPERPAGKEAARKKDQDEYRYGGIPIGSDPRE